MIYVFDTNSLRTLSSYYPDTFPSFWEAFGAAVESGEVSSVREVYNELEGQFGFSKRDLENEEKFRRLGWLWQWLSTHKAMFTVPGPEETRFLPELFGVRQFRALVGEKQLLKGQPVADPFLISRARAVGGCVVTEEVAKPNSAKIPNICDHFDIDCTDLRGFLGRKGWRF